MRARLVVTALMLTAAWLPGVPAAGADGARLSIVPAVQPAFAATMPDRFGTDADGDGLVDLPNTAEYARNCSGICSGRARFTLRLDASASRASLDGTRLPITGYRWRITGGDGLWLARSTARPLIEAHLPEGAYRVTLDVEAALSWGTATARAEREVVVEDLLIVAVGDSYASGEGNPERPLAAGADEALWADSPGDTAAEAAHAAAHRSTVSWPALAALALERADPGTSVTFISLAASGARVGLGLLEAQWGDGGPGQLAQVAALIGGRPIDALLMSIGGNDIGFPRIVRGLVDADPQGDPVCYGVDLENVWRSAADGDWNRGSGLRFGLPWGIGCRETQETGRPVLAGLAGLGGELDALAAAIETGLDATAVYVMEYGDPTRAGGDVTCPEIAGDLTPPLGLHEIDSDEQAAARELVLEPLNRGLAEAAGRHGWHYVDGVTAAFSAGHGYCAPAPDYRTADGDTAPAPMAPYGRLAPEGWYRHPMSEALGAFLAEPGVSWYRTAGQSVVLQGPGARWDSRGTLHPNELGHLAMAGILLQAMARAGP